MTSFLRSLFLAGVAGATCFGCVREQGRTNGQGGSLEFTVATNADVNAPLALGFAVEVDVSRYDAYWACPDLGKSVPGTRTTDVRVQSCGSNPEPISLIDARCDDDACTVTSKADGSGTVKLLVTGTRGGDTTLHVDVKSTTSGSTWGDSYPLSFSAPSRIAILRNTESTVGTTYACVPGATFVLCPELRDANDVKLGVSSDAISTAISGDASVVVDVSPSEYVDTGCVPFYSTAAGTSSIDFAATGVAASASIKVVDPTHIASAELYAVTKHLAIGAEVGDDPLLESTPTTSLTMSASDVSPYGVYDLASVLHMKDGSLALGGAGVYKSSFANALFLETGQDSDIASQYLSVSPQGNVVGDGTLDATFGAVKVSIPFHITR